MYAYTKLHDINEILTVVEDLYQVADFLERMGQNAAAAEVILTAMAIENHKEVIKELGERISSVVFNAELWQNGAGNERNFVEQYNNWKLIRKYTDKGKK